MTSRIRVTGKRQVKREDQKSWADSHKPTDADIRADAVRLLAEYVPQAVALQIAEKYGLSLKEAKRIVRQARETASTVHREGKRLARAMGWKIVFLGVVMAVLAGALGAFDVVDQQVWLYALLMSGLTAFGGLVQTITGNSE